MVQHQRLKNRPMPQSPTKPPFAKIILASFAFFLFCICVSPVAFAKVFNAQTLTLDNGLQIVVVNNKRSPVITHMIWYKVGAADEHAGFSGMAHYLEHLLFKGTDKYEPGEFSRTVKRYGGNDNAFTSYDFTAYFQSIGKEHLEKMMIMEADRMLNAAPPPEHYASEKQVVLEERRQNTENDPRSLFNEQMRSIMFVNHPYGTPVIGWMDEIKTYEWNDVKAFYDRWYAPNNAIVIISGDVTIDDVKPIAEKTYGILPVKDIPSKTRPVLPPSDALTTLSKSHPAIHEPSFQKIFLGPSYASNRQEALALDILQEILSGGPTKRLYKSLVVDQKIAISAGMASSSDALDFGTLWLYGTPSAGISLPDLEKAIEAEVQNIIQNGVTDQEVADAILRMQDAAIFARDSLAGPAMIIGRAMTTGQSLDEIENWPQDIAKITAEDVKAVAAKYLNPSVPYHRAPVTGYLTPQAGDLAGDKE